MTRKPFKLRFLGTGNAWTKPPLNYHTNAFIEVDGRRFLIDCGFLCPLALARVGLNFDAIEATFISHLHGDHVMGLEEVCFQSYFCHHKRVSLWLPAHLFSSYSGIPGADIWDNCLRASLETYDLCFEPPKLLTFSDYADVELLFEGQSYDFVGVEMALTRVEHAPNRPCFGLFIGRRVVFTSDSAFSRERIERWLSDGAEVIFHDVSFCHKCGAIHASFNELATLPREMAERVILMHYSDEIRDEDRKRAVDLGFRFADVSSDYVF